MGKLVLCIWSALEMSLSYLYIRSIVLFHKEQYAEAHRHFQSCQSLNPNERSLATWLRKAVEKLPPPEPGTKAHDVYLDKAV